MDTAASRENIPDSVLPYPKGIYNRSKYVFWKFIYPIHNAARDVLLRAGLIRHSGRQDFVIGTIAEGKTMSEFVRFLVDAGWCNHFIAWQDDDQVLSLRKLADFEYQYHLRVFSDGEVRGHFEYTPESHPIWHVKGVEQESRFDEFLQFLEGWINPAADLVPAAAEY